MIYLKQAMRKMNKYIKNIKVKENIKSQKLTS